MQFLNPASFALAALLAVPVVLYFFRRKSKTVEVSTLVFFKSLAREHQESAWLRRLKRLLSLLLTLIVFTAAILALVRVVFAPKSEELRSVVILLDRSASMAAVDKTTGRDRLEAAKDEIRTRMAGLPETVGVALISYDGRPEIVQPKTLVRRSLLRELKDVELRPVEDNVDAALATARRVAELETPSVIWHVTDRPAEVLELEVDPEGEETGEGEGTPEVSGDEEEESIEIASERERLKLPAGVTMETVNVGLPAAVNVGITAFEVSKVPLVQNQYEAFIQVGCSSSSDEPVEATLEVLISGTWADTPRKIDVKPGTTEGLIMPISGAASGQILEIRLTGVEADNFALDDAVIARLPESRPVVLAWITEEPDPFTQLALNAVAEEGELDVLVGKPENWPVGDGIDVVMFDGWVPKEFPKDTASIVIDPNESTGPVRAVRLAGSGIPHDSVRVTNDQHPLLFRVSSGRVAVTQTSVIDTSGSLEPLWFAGNEPILAAGDVDGQRLVIMGFSAQKSEQLPLMASYPLLIGNAVLWCAEKASAAQRMRMTRTGELVNATDGYVDWIELTGGGKTREVRQEAATKLVELDRIGIWSTAEGEEGSALLLSRHETDFPKFERASEDPEATGKGKVATYFKGDITWLFLWLIPVVLLIESWLFHRHAVY